MFDRYNRRALLIAMTLGDGYIREKNSKVKGYKSYKLAITHCAAQKEYLEYKRELLKECFESRIPKIREIDNNGHLGYSLEKGDKYLRIIYKRLYRNGKKVILRKTLDLLTPHAIAIWYMDDGSCYYKRDKEGKIKSIETVISTYCSESEIYTIIDYFKEVWGVEWKIKKNKGKYSLRIGKKESVVFFDIIREHVHESMLYKLKC